MAFMLLKKFKLCTFASATSTKEVMCLVEFVCLSVSRIKKKTAGQMFMKLGGRMLNGPKKEPITF